LTLATQRGYGTFMDIELVGWVSETLRRWPVPTGATRIGRGTDLPVSLPDRSVSREHAVLERGADSLVLQDLGSRNGTTVNGERIVGPREVRAGDRIAFGSVVLTLEAQAVEARPALTEHVRLDSTVKLNWNEVRAAPAGATTSATALFDVISNLGEFLVHHQPEQQIYDACLDAVEKLIPFQRACLLLLDEHHEPVVKASRYKSATSTGALALSRTIVDTVIHERASLHVQDAQADPRFNVAQSVILEQIRAALVVPLFDNTKVIGVLYADTRELVSPYTADHLRQLAWLGNLLAVKITNARLLEAARDQERIQQEIATAARIQRTLLQQDLPCPPGYELHARLEPSTEVGGDLYDVRDLGGGRFALVLGDVVGHGVGAALLMANALAAIRALAGELKDPVRIIEKVHAQIYETTEPSSYLTLFLGILDTSTHSLEFVNAGHQEAPAIFSATSAPVLLAATGPPLGLLPVASFESGRASIPVGALLAAWSDGIPEAHVVPEGDATPLFFGESERWLEELSADAPLATIGARLFARVDAFLAGRKAPDDRTLLLLRRVR
jgi:sigma-B regulation protein RsbU (phosphoserine phosphatase)